MHLGPNVMAHYWEDWEDTRAFIDEPNPLPEDRIPVNRRRRGLEHFELTPLRMFNL